MRGVGWEVTFVHCFGTEEMEEIGYRCEDGDKNKFILGIVLN